VGLRDVVRVDRREQADQDDQQEEDERGNRQPVAQEASQGEPPWAPPCDPLLARREAELFVRLVGELGRALPLT
jgi:hypothetical protein